MVDHSQDEVLVLADKLSLTGGMALKRQLFILIAVLAAIACMFWYLLAPVDWSVIGWRKLLLNSAQFLLVLGILALQLAWVRRAARLERLVLSPDGIRYISPLPQRLKWICPDVLLPWGEISSAELSIPKGVARKLEFVILSFKSDAKTKNISPLRWVNPDTYIAPAKSWWKFEPSRFRQEEQDLVNAVSASEVVRYVTRHIPRLAIDPRLTEATTMTALEHDRHGRVAIAIIVLLFAYMFFDFVLGPESYVDKPTALVHLYAIAGIVGAVLSGIWLSKSSLKAPEKAGLAILLGVITSVAMLPGALRINTLLDTQGLVTYDCRVVLEGQRVILKPFAAEVPAVSYFARNEYWEKLNKDDVYQVRIRKGLLGFYQFDSVSIIERMRNDMH